MMSRLSHAAAHRSAGSFNINTDIGFINYENVTPGCML